MVEVFLPDRVNCVTDEVNPIEITARDCEMTPFLCRNYFNKRCIRLKAGKESFPCDFIFPKWRGFEGVVALWRETSFGFKLILCGRNADEKGGSAFMF